MNILALDLGTKTGFAIYNGESIVSGTKKLRNSKSASGLRFVDFRRWLIDTIKSYRINEIYYERVYRHCGTEAGHVYGGFLYHLAAVVEELNVKCTGIPVSTIKKLATGNGKATKEDMMKAARNNGFNPLDDNEADSLAILMIALKRLKESGYADLIGTSWRLNLTGGRTSLTA
jgi:Holliday junction resolvasome RuvABC endonuclease subunit